MHSMAARKQPPSPSSFPEPGRKRFFIDRDDRAVRYSSKTERDREQAMIDFFGAQPILSLRANMRSMDSILSEITSTLPQEDDTLSPEVLRAGWERAAGAFISSQAELLSIVKGTATIRTSQPAIRYELTRQKNTLIAKLCAEFGGESITGIRILHG